jgi:hypothetical protein
VDPPAASTSAMPVSSHDDSTARTSGPLTRVRAPAAVGSPGPLGRLGAARVERRAEPRDPLAHRGSASGSVVMISASSPSSL